MAYEYEDYLVLYKALGGTTTHYCPGAGTKGWHHRKLSSEEFADGMARLEEINSHDDEWLMREHSHDYIDVSESECWECLHLRSRLFVTEWERYQAIRSQEARNFNG